jgi:hypothetical protein
LLQGRPTKTCSFKYSNFLDKDFVWKILSCKSLIPSKIRIEFHLANCRCTNGGNATLSQFEEVLKAMEMSSLVPLAARIFDLFDNNRDGTIDMREIIGGFSCLKYSQGDDALLLCFQVKCIS